MGQEKVDNKSDTRRQVSSDFCIKYLIHTYQGKVKEIQDILKDEDGLKKEEVDHLAGNRPGKPQDIWMNFYDKIKESKDYHKKHGNVGAKEVRSPEWFYERALDEDTSEQAFSLEEDYGRRVDMHTGYQEFL